MLRTVLLATLATGLFAPAVSAQTVPDGFAVDTVVTSGLSSPHDFCFLPDGRALIANGGGGVSLWTGGSTLTSVGTVSGVEFGGERGLLSIEADPNFGTNGYIYIWWSPTADSFMHLDRLTCTGDLSNPTSTNLSFSMTSRRAIIASAPDSAFNHNGGSCRFGPDGMLYLTIGDDASSCSAQSLTAKRGVLLRMDVAGLGPAASLVEPAYSSIDPGDNPNSASTGFDQLVIAYGLRNPFRMEVDQVTGNCYIGDVGQSAQEEYSEYVMPASNPPLINFGWPWREGNGTYNGCGGSAPAGLTGPLYATTDSGWNSIMGGPRYRNQTGSFDFGVDYEGDCFFADYFSGDIRRITFNGSTWTLAPQVSGQPSATNWSTGWGNLVSMRQGPDGAIYVLQRSNAFKRLRKLAPTNSVVIVSGDGQRGTAYEQFAQPVRVQVLDTVGSPLPNGVVNFSSSTATLSATTVVADASGFAEVDVTPTGSSVTVNATTPGSFSEATFSLFARKVNVTWIPASGFLIVSFANQSSATPASIPLILMMSYPGVATIPTPIGPVCTDPGYALTVVMQDGTGAFGGADFAGSGSLGTPAKTWLYSGVPQFLINGFDLRFQVIGLDPVDGWIRSGCELKQF